MEILERIKKLVIIAMFSDDDLMDLLVLKGGNALDIIYGISMRASVDQDFSMEKDFDQKELNVIQEKIQKVLSETFHREGYEVFDITFEKRPKEVSPDMADFWGGYRVEFKIIESDKYREFHSNLDSLRRRATVVGPRQKKTYWIDISKYEFCATKTKHELDGYTIYVYTPEMIVCEKIRAICQQMPEYAAIVRSAPTARARDFVDIYALMQHYPIDLGHPENIELLKKIFAAKKVPLELIGKIKDYKEYHRQDFPAVKDTVGSSSDLQEFDFYFNYLVEKIQALKTLGII